MPRKKKAPNATIEPEHEIVPAKLDVKKTEDYYQRLRRRMRRWLASPQGQTAHWAAFLLFAPDLFHLVVRLALDPQVTLANRARLAATAAYFMSPLDLIPELIVGPIGLLDDIALVAYVLHRLINTSDRAIVERHWAGDTDLLTLLKEILSSTNAMLGGLVAGKLRTLAARMPGARSKP